MRLTLLTLALVVMASSGAAIAREPVRGSGPTGGTDPTQAGPEGPPRLATTPPIRGGGPTRPEPAPPSAVKTGEPGTRPGDCVLRPGNPLGCGTGESPRSFMITYPYTAAGCRSMGGTVVTSGALSRCRFEMK